MVALGHGFVMFESTYTNKGLVNSLLLRYSPNSCLQHGALARNLSNWLVWARFVAR